MSGFLVWIVVGLQGFVAVMFGYQAVRAVWGLRVPPASRVGSKTRFAVVVPAHNEEGAIGPLLTSLSVVRYSRSSLHALIVADHCTDGTVARVRTAGFECVDRQAGPRGKTASLVEGIRRLMETRGDEIDAVAFFDADNIVDPEFFGEVAALLEAGHPVIQGNVGVQNWNATLFSRLNYMNAVVENRMEELARSQAGLTCNLRGHGMVFRRDVLESVPWEASTLVEDQEMLVRLVLAGYRVVWAQHARVASVLPETAREAKTQRQRWAGGRSAILVKSVCALWRRWRMEKDAVAFHLMIDFIIPSHAVQLSLAFLALALAVFIAGPVSALTAFATGLLGLYFLYFLVGNLLSGVPPRTFLSVLWAPGFIFWRTWIYLSSLKGVSRWR